jgi:hypothetical protein
MTKTHKFAGILMIAVAMNCQAQGLGGSLTTKPTPSESTSRKTASEPAAKPGIAQESSTQKIEAAGIQFTVPKDWKLEEKPGPVGPAYRVISKDGATFGFIAIQEDDLQSRIAALHEAVKKSAKDFKQAPEQTSTVNGMEYVHQVDTMDGGAATQDVGYVKGTLPVILVQLGDAPAMKARTADLQAILQSVKKSE